MKDTPEDHTNGVAGKYLLWLITGSGLVGVLAAGFISIASDAQIAIKVAEQHGQELLLLRGEINSIRLELKEGTLNRYTSVDAKRYEEYTSRRISDVETKLEKLEERMKR